MSVLGRPAASGSSSPRQGVGNGPVRVPLGRQDNFFLNGLDNFFVDKCLLAPGRGVSRHPKKKKKGSRKETPAIRNHWFDKMHQSAGKPDGRQAAEGGAWPAGTRERQRCSSISSNHHEKNGWDEHRPVIFRKPTHLHTDESWPRRRRGEGDLNRRRVGRAHRPRAGGPPLAAPTPTCVPPLGRPVKAISLGRFL